MNYSVNQVHQLYVADDYTANSTTKGQISKVVKTPENELFIVYNGAGGAIHSDLIPLDKISYAKAVDAADCTDVMRKIEITLNSSYLSSSKPLVGQDYTLGINFKGFFSPGDDSQYYKDVAVHVTTGMTESDFYKAMVNALNQAFSREDGATATTNPYLKFSWKPNGVTATQADALVIEELPQDWTLGTKKEPRIYFDVFPGLIWSGGDDVCWATYVDATKGYYTDVTTSDSSTLAARTIGNGKKVADLEWFCAGERGDQYRMVGWPNYVHTDYMADASKEYHLIEIHYAFTDSGVNSYRTEKDLTIAVPKGAGAANYTAVNKVIGAINTAAGSTLITTLS